MSLIENGCIELSSSIVMLFKSDCSRSIFLVPLKHSAKLNRTTLNLLAELKPEAGVVGN